MLKQILVKMFIPSAKSLADMAAAQIYAAVNGLDKAAQIANLAKYADILTDIQAKICVLLKDGKIDEAEKQKIAADLEPFIEKLLKML